MDTGCNFAPAEYDGYQHCGEHGGDRHPGAEPWQPCPRIVTCPQCSGLGCEACHNVGQWISDGRPAPVVTPSAERPE